MAKDELEPKTEVIAETENYMAWRLKSRMVKPHTTWNSTTSRCISSRRNGTSCSDWSSF